MSRWANITTHQTNKNIYKTTPPTTTTENDYHTWTMEKHIRRNAPDTRTHHMRTSSLSSALFGSFKVKTSIGKTRRRRSIASAAPMIVLFGAAAWSEHVCCRYMHVIMHRYGIYILMCSTHSPQKAHACRQVHHTRCLHWRNKRTNNQRAAQPRQPTRKSYEFHLENV